MQDLMQNRFFSGIIEIWDDRRLVIWIKWPLQGERMKTLYVSDLDGTLLDRNAEVTKHTADLLNRLIERGILFTVATARSVESTLHIVSGLRLNLPFVIYNGTMIIDPKTCMPVVRPCFFSGEQVRFAFEVFRQAGIYPLVYTYTGGRTRLRWVEGRENAGVQDFLLKRKGDPRFCPCKSYDELMTGDIFYFSFLDVPGGHDDVSRRFIDSGLYHVNVQKDTYADYIWLEVMCAEAGKAAAVLRIKELVGADRIVCFGDNQNDLSMFRVSDACYAVSNAEEAIKAAACGVIGRADEDAVARWLCDNWL